MTPFLTIVTRCCKRPVMLSQCIESVASLNDKDVEQIFIVDNEQRGILAANRSLNEHAYRITGKYVYILDDDTRLVNSNFLRFLKEAPNDPDIIMVRSRRPQFAPRLLPNQNVWGHPTRLKLATTNCLTYVVKAGLWRKNIKEFGYNAAGDWTFLKAMMEQKPSIAWINHIMSETQQLGRGKSFEDCDENWFKDVIRKHKLIEVTPGDWRLIPKLRASITPARPVTRPVPSPKKPKPIQPIIVRNPSKARSSGSPSPNRHVILGRRIKR